jgi:hypothetical protein
MVGGVCPLDSLYSDLIVPFMNPSFLLAFLSVLSCTFSIPLEKDSCSQMCGEICLTVKIWGTEREGKPRDCKIK